MSQSVTVRRITVTALMSALIFVLTVLPRIPTPIGGYVHLGDVGIMFSALAFGPWVATVAGGIGTALADIGGGYAQFAFFSFLVHGAQGAMVAVLARKLNSLRLALAVIAGALIVMGGYFLAEVVLYGMGEAILELVPNFIQGLVGGIIGVPLYIMVRKAYPPLSRYRGNV